MCIKFNFLKNEAKGKRSVPFELGSKALCCPAVQFGSQDWGWGGSILLVHQNGSISISGYF